MSAVFHHSPDQKRIALETKKLEEKRRGSEIHTEIASAGTFTLAEDYHQKYYLRQDGQLLAEYAAIYPELNDFVHSSAVTRVNGFVGGSGTSVSLELEISSLGLSAEGQGARGQFLPFDPEIFDQTTTVIFISQATLMNQKRGPGTAVLQTVEGLLKRSDGHNHRLDTRVQQAQHQSCRRAFAGNGHRTPCPSLDVFKAYHHRAISITDTASMGQQTIVVQNVGESAY